MPAYQIDEIPSGNGISRLRIENCINAIKKNYNDGIRNLTATLLMDESATKADAKVCFNFNASSRSERSHRIGEPDKPNVASMFALFGIEVTELTNSDAPASSTMYQKQYSVTFPYKSIIDITNAFLLEAIPEEAPKLQGLC